MNFTLTIPKSQIADAYKHSLKEAAEHVTVKGFRKGKAPLDRVEREVGKQNLYEDVVRHVFPPAYADYIKKNKLEPITSPKVNIKSANELEDWEFEVEIAQKPVVQLGDYTKTVKADKAVSAIWTPGSGQSADQKDEAKREEKLSKIFDSLLKSVKIEIPSLLIEEEVNRSLSRLVSQIEKLGLTVDQYLASMNKTSESLKQEYATNAEVNLKIEFILDAIAKEENLTVSDKEYNDFFAKVTDPETKKALTNDPSAQTSIKYTLTKQKVLDHLLSL